MTDYPDELWRSVADLSGLLLAEETQETTLRRVSDLAVRSIASCDAVGMTLFVDGQPTTRAATGGLVYEVDHYQYDINEGPCLQTVLDNTIVAVADMADEPRWPRFCEHAAERGVHASLSLPLAVRGKVLGALNLYAHEAGAFGDADRKTGVMFAAQAAAALANALTYFAAVKVAGELREALDSRAVIDQAMGILIGENGYSQELAFETLRTTSQSQNCKLRHVAEEIVRTAMAPRDNPKD
ncbi:MAG TPA: GAF and ANTAR domain-containing protein [Acidimicrobiales bacterium]|nr:GAF and ANTAR domain-containing protein [Acidimicrobiales bacterium]